MVTLNILKELSFNDRVKYVNSIDDNLSESEFVVINELKEKDFGIDSVYFNTDENGNSFPAVFLKKVESFDAEILPIIVNIHRKIWNYKKVLFLYVYTETEIRIYNCSEKPLIKTKENFDYNKELKSIELKTCQFSDKEHLEELIKLFSRIAIDTGIIWTLDLKEAQLIRNKIKLQRRIDKYLVYSLINTARQLEQQGLNIEFIHKIILRSLFLLYLEDRGATDEKLYTQCKKGAKSYLDILEDVGATYALYKKLDEYFNGNVFTLENEENVSVEQLRIIKKCFISGNDNTSQNRLFEDWRLFDFSIIQIELLSEIYEEFLYKTDPELKKKTGTYYTPPALVEFMMNDRLPITKNDKNYKIKILDPSCGSGIFLVESFKRLVKRHENQYNNKLTDFETLTKLLTDNIFGIELHPQAIKVAAFSLYLALVDNLDPKTLWQKEKHRLPVLINDSEDKSLTIQGKNLFRRDTISDISKITELQKFDLVIGNPPFGKLMSEKKDIDNKQRNIREYCDRNGFAKEMVLPFLHKATTFAPKGKIALIFNTKVLTNTESTYQEFRKWLFNQCYVEKVFNFSILRDATGNFGGQLFGNATGPISILFYQKITPPKPSDKIVYYAPKTYIKSNMIEGLCIDPTDLKYLPREECKKPDTKIWKVAAWGGINDWDLITRLSNSKLHSVEGFVENMNIKSGVGFQLLTQKEDKPRYSEKLTNLKYLDADFITKYYTPCNVLDNVKKSIKSPQAIGFYKEHYSVKNIADIERLTAFRRLGDMAAFTNPHIVVKKGLEQNNVCASFIENECSFRDGVYGFYTDNIEELYLLLSYFNSKFSTYYLFMTISSYGIEREQIMKNEYFSLPINLSNQQSSIIKEATKEILSKFRSKSFLHNTLENQEIENIIENMDKVIFESLDLSESDVNMIYDCINYSIDLFHKKEKSQALYPVLQNQIIEYGETICNELNDFLEGHDLFANATVYKYINPSTPLMMIKLTHEETKKESITESPENIDKELKKLDQFLWTKHSNNIYFRRKLNYYDGDDILIVRPNQRRFWSKSMAMEDASELILEILTWETRN